MLLELMVYRAGKMTWLWFQVFCLVLCCCSFLLLRVRFRFLWIFCKLPEKKGFEMCVRLRVALPCCLMQIFSKVGASEECMNSRGVNVQFCIWLLVM